MEVDLSAPTRTDPAAGASADGPEDGRLALIGAVVLVGFGIALRFGATSDLWLDEALTVQLAQLPLDELRPALVRDGAPPLYYVLLHGWIAVFGASTEAVRALSGVLGTFCIGLGYLAGRAWLPDPRRGRALGALTAVVVATSPYAIRYSTEARMYALTMTLGFLGVVLAASAWREPTLRRLVGIGIVTAGLLYTQYWALFLVAVIGVGLGGAVALGRDTTRRRARRLLLAVVGGLIVFVPWWPTFSEQLAHTGTPWDAPTTIFAGGWRAAAGFGGTGWLRWVVAAAFFAAIGFAWFRARDLRTLARCSGVAGLATIVVGVVGSTVVGTGFQDRYVAVAFPLLAFTAAIGGAALHPVGVRIVAVAIVAVLGLVAGARWVRAERTASTAIAAAVRRELRSGDIVAYCPDQLGPSTARLLPRATVQVTFPELDDARVVDWTDYEQRQHAASPGAFADVLLARAENRAVFLVWSGGYRTLGAKCEATVNALSAARPTHDGVTVADGPNGEQVAVQRYAP